jgi:hypothetical protein
MPAELSIDLDRDEPTTEHLPLRQRLRRRSPIRTIAGAGAVAIIAGVALAAASAVGGPSPAPAAPQPPPATVAEQHARVIAPATAAPGERVVVLAYRNSNVCGPAELRLDGGPLPQQILAYAGRDSNAYEQLFIWVDLPVWATPGTHRIDLLGPVQADRGGICGDHPERQLRIDSTAISITAKGSD